MPEARSFHSVGKEGAVTLGRGRVGPGGFVGMRHEAKGSGGKMI